jgi:ParB-like chromosome segregation protein Spo0J
MKIESVKPARLTPAPWRATHVLKPDLKILSDSISDYGLLSPLIVQKSSGLVIDGYHRLIAISSSKSLTKSYGDGVPCVLVNVDDIDAMVMHVRVNRPKGSIVAKHMSSIVKQIYQSRKYTIEQIDELFNMNVTESELMLDGSLIKMRKIKEHVYSPAWVPIEAPSGAQESVVLERPPNDDR